MPRSLRKKPANWYKRIGIATLVLAVIGGLVWVAMYSIKMGGNLVMGVRLDGGPSGPPAHSSTQYNYKFIFPDAPWVLDDPTKFDFRANLGFRRTNPTAFMALIANDFKSRTPRTAELIGRGLRFLNDYFEDIDRGEPAEINFGGQPAQLLAFQGAVRKTNARMAGECVMLSYRGVGYWMACWADEGTFPTVRKDFEMLRTKFVLLQERRDWQEKRPKAVDYPGSKADYALRDTEAMWKPEEKPESFDELADQAFVAHEKDDPGRIIDKEDRSDDPKKDLSRNSATVQVLVMNEAKSVDAATDAALAYIEEKQKKLSPDATVSKPLTDTRDPLGGVPARQVTLRVTIKEGTERYFQVAVVPRPMGVVVIVGECDWKASAKGKWVSDFTQFIKSFRAEKGKAAKGGG